MEMNQDLVYTANFTLAFLEYMKSSEQINK
jgi:hypothetical protein